MESIKAYKFCPRCGGNLKEKNENVLVCSKCGFHFYISAAPCNGVLIRNEKGEIMLVKRKFEPKKDDWDWPGGFLNAEESLEHSVVREIKEELGVEIQMEKIVGVYTGTYLFQNIDRPLLCIAVTAKITGGKLKVSDDVSKYRYFPPAEILKMELAFENIRMGVSDYLKNP